MSMIKANLYSCILKQYSRERNFLETSSLSVNNLIAKGKKGNTLQSCFLCTTERQKLRTLDCLVWQIYVRLKDQGLIS